MEAEARSRGSGTPWAGDRHREGSRCLCLGGSPRARAAGPRRVLVLPGAPLHAVGCHSVTAFLPCQRAPDGCMGSRHRWLAKVCGPGPG